MKKTFKEQAKEFIQKHKKKFILGGIIIGSAAIKAICTLTIKKNQQNNDNLVLPEESNEPEKLYKMQFIDPDTNEVVWTEECYESYVNDFRNIE